MIINDNILTDFTCKEENGQPIVKGIQDDLDYQFTFTDIAGKYQIIDLIVKYEELQNLNPSWTLSIKNSKGPSTKAKLSLTKKADWTQWSSWSQCTKSCKSIRNGDENGTKSKSRQCNEGINSKVTCSSLSSTQSSQEIAECAGNGPGFAICDEDYAWNVWTEWGDCSPSCGETSRRKRVRSCIPHIGNGRPCPSNFETAQEKCNVPECPRDCKSGPWLDWGACSKTCTSGTSIPIRKRARELIPGNERGNSCDGITVQESEVCQKDPCPIDGKWSPWGRWSGCSHTCGGGKRRRNRFCVEPNETGKPCPLDGITQEEEKCNKQKCPCVWTEWDNWSTCDEKCGIGQTTRTRTGMRFCQGKGNLQK